jgi:hypothetical protein
MSQLMSKYMPIVGSCVGPEKNVRPGGECLSTKFCIQLACFLSRMHADLGEICAEARFHVFAQTLVQGCAAAPLSLDPSCEASTDRASSGTNRFRICALRCAGDQAGNGVIADHALKSEYVGCTERLGWRHRQWRQCIRRLITGARIRNR